MPVGQTLEESGSGAFSYAAEKPLPPIMHLLPMSQLQPGMGLRRHVEPFGVTPSVICVALISKSFLLPSL